LIASFASERIFRGSIGLSRLDVFKIGDKYRRNGGGVRSFAYVDLGHFVGIAGKPHFIPRQLRHAG
jgi:hypothetical protein